jgi:hypothetical protein
MLAAISWPVWVVLAAITALSLAWEANFGGMADKIKQWWSIATLVIQGVVAVFETLNGSVGEIQGKLAEDIEAKGLVGLVTTVGRIVYRIKEFFVGFGAGVRFTFDQIWRQIGPVFGWIGSALGQLGRALAQVTGLFGEASAATNPTSWNITGQAVGAAAAAFMAGYAAVVAFRSALLVYQGIALAVTAVQWLFNAAFIASPIGWIMLLVLGLAACAVKLYANWETVSTFFTWIWDGVKATFSSALDWISSINLFDAGMNILSSLGDGITAKASGLFETVKSALNPLTNLFNHSDAKEGPLSAMTAAGASMLQTMASGVTMAAPDLAGTVEGALAQTVEPVAAPLPATEAKAEPSRSAGPGRQVVIRIGNLNLSGVGDADGFISHLQRLAEQYDVGGEVALA